MQQAVRCLAVQGRAAMVALSRESVSLLPYPDLINKEAEVIGVSDHLASELLVLMDLVRKGKLCFPEGTSTFRPSGCRTNQRRPRRGREIHATPPF